jgi:hypothetical protein
VRLTVEPGARKLTAPLLAVQMLAVFAPVVTSLTGPLALMVPPLRAKNAGAPAVVGLKLPLGTSTIVPLART